MSELQETEVGHRFAVIVMYPGHITYDAVEDKDIGDPELLCKGGEPVVEGIDYNDVLSNLINGLIKDWKVSEFNLIKG